MSHCEFLPWDSTFFGRRIGRLAGESVTRSDMADADRWAAEQRIDCLYFLAAIEDAETVRVACDHGFRLMDLRLTYEQKTSEVALPAGIRAANASDLPTLQDMARGTFVDTRFYRDPHFAPKADALYETWIDRAVAGFADTVLVACDAEGCPSGFVCCHRREGNRGEVGLTGVREDRRGKGIGGLLVSAALAWFYAQNLTSAFVVTNGANLPAQRLYQRCGFRSSQVQLWFHRWLAHS